MHKSIYKLAFSVIVVIMVACSDIIEQDLTGIGVVLLTPQNDYVTTNNSIEFKWEEVPGADEYQIQIARPDLLAPQQFALDCTITSTQYTAVLDTGDFQWRVRALNNSSNTQFYTRSIRVEATDDLSQQTVGLLSPTDGLITSQNALTFKWAPLITADLYNFELRSGSQTGALVNSTSASSDTIQLASINDGVFAWGVQASNALPSNTAFSWRSLTIDATPPSAPTLILPTNNAILGDSVNTFSWTSGTDATTSTSDSLYIWDTSDQALIVATVLASPAYSDSLGPGNYSWQVNTVDAAANAAASELRLFSVQ